MGQLLKHPFLTFLWLKMYLEAVDGMMENENGMIYKYLKP